MGPTEMKLFLCRTADGALLLKAEDGRLVLRGRSYRQLRHDLERLLRADARAPREISILIGQPPTKRSPPGEAPSYQPSPSA